MRVDRYESVPARSAAPGRAGPDPLPVDVTIRATHRISGTPIVEGQTMAGVGLLVVDVQNDFCPGGGLPVPRGDEVVPVMNAYIQRFVEAGSRVYASRDWHPIDSHHFREHGGLWPPHCLQGSTGAAFRADLALPRDVVVVSSGVGVEDEGYSAFEGATATGETFAERLRQDGVTHLYLGGLATDYCVRASALDARREGFAVTLLLDASRGIDVEPGDSERAVAEMKAAGVEIASLDAVRLGAG